MCVDCGVCLMKNILYIYYICIKVVESKIKMQYGGLHIQQKKINVKRKSFVDKKEEENALLPSY